MFWSEIRDISEIPRDDEEARRPVSGGSGPFERDDYAALIMYPAPRTVWIIGSRPVSIFLRRYEM